MNSAIQKSIIYAEFISRTFSQEKVSKIRSTLPDLDFR